MELGKTSEMNCNLYNCNFRWCLISRRIRKLSELDTNLQLTIILCLIRETFESQFQLVLHFLTVEFSKQLETWAEKFQENSETNHWYCSSLTNYLIKVDLVLIQLKRLELCFGSFPHKILHGKFLININKS